jgi:hypothetical protein
MLIGSGAGSLRPGEISGFRELDVSGVRTGESARGGLTFWGIWPIVVPSWRGPRLCFATGILTAALPHRCRPLARGWKSPGTSLSTNVINTKQNSRSVFFLLFRGTPTETKYCDRGRNSSKINRAELISRIMGLERPITKEQTVRRLSLHYFPSRKSRPALQEKTTLILYCTQRN